MTDYTETLAALAASSDEQVAALYARYVAGEIDADTLIALATAVLVAQDARAASVADVALATALTAQTGRVVLALGLTAPPRTAVLHDLMRTALADPAPQRAITTQARAATLETAQRTYQSGMRRHGVARWRRVANAGACPVCRKFEAEGSLPVTVDMWHHTGCSCTQTPIPATQLEDTNV